VGIKKECATKVGLCIQVVGNIQTIISTFCEYHKQY